MPSADQRAEQRAKLADKLRREGRDDLAERLDRCAEQLHLTCICCAAQITVDRGCARRWCPVCGPRITAKRFVRFARIASRFQWPLAVTLTRANTRLDADGLALFKESFRAFRRTKFWKNNVKGGIAGFEITHRGRGLHPHLHALIDCRWLAVATPPPQRGHTRAHIAELCRRAQEELSQVWGAYVQGRDAIVWVQRAAHDRDRGTSGAILETIKYAVKPADLLRRSTTASVIIDQLDLGRAVTSFGHAHASSKEFVGLDEPEPLPKLCRSCEADRSLLPAELAAKLKHRHFPPSPRIEKLLRRGEILEDAKRLGIRPDDWLLHQARWAQNTMRPRALD